MNTPLMEIVVRKICLRPLVPRILFSNTIGLIVRNLSAMTTDCGNSIVNSFLAPVAADTSQRGNVLAVNIIQRLPAVENFHDE